MVHSQRNFQSFASLSTIRRMGCNTRKSSGKPPLAAIESINVYDFIKLMTIKLERFDSFYFMYSIKWREKLSDLSQPSIELRSIDIHHFSILAIFTDPGFVTFTTSAGCPPISMGRDRNGWQLSQDLYSQWGFFNTLRSHQAK